jgi:hypothetical protein
MEPKQAVLESKIDYVKMGINGKLELLSAHQYGYYEQVMTQLAVSISVTTMVSNNCFQFNSIQIIKESLFSSLNANCVITCS